MAACEEIKGIDDVEDELTRLRDIVRAIHAGVSSEEPGAAAGLLWIIDDVSDDIERIIAGIQKIEEARP